MFRKPWLWSLCLACALAGVAASAQAYYVTEWVSEEGDILLCPAGQAVIGVGCSGRYCDNVQLICDKEPTGGPWHGYTMVGPFSDCPAGGDCHASGVCPGSGVMKGIECEGRYCDNLRIYCSGTRGSGQLQPQQCSWSEWVSEEQGQKVFPPGHYICGIECRGSYCDNMRFKVCTMAVTGLVRHELQPGQVLLPGQALSSPNGRYRFTYQADGNLVLYDGARALWASGTAGQPANYTVMQTDGNLVIYDNEGQPVWATDTLGDIFIEVPTDDGGIVIIDIPGAGSRLVVQNDGNVVIYSQNHPRWATNTMQP